jgi:hypothetical protein
VTPQDHRQDPQAAHDGPSWFFMLFLIFLAMLVALGIAWAFISPLVHRH